MKASKLLSEQAVLFRVSRYLDARDQMLIRRHRCSLGPAFLLDLKQGKVIERNIADVQTFAEQRGLVRPGERVR